MILRSRRVVLPDGERPASVHVRDGRIEAIGPYQSDGVDLGDLALLPGLVDTHVHVNEPGRTEWEGFATATRAAAAGGVTTLVDMPLNSIPPTVDVASLELKRAAARGQCHVDVGFWGGAVPGNAGRAAGVARGRGVRLQVLPHRLRRAGVPAVGPGRPRRRAWPPSTRSSWCTPRIRRSFVPRRRRVATPTSSRSRPPWAEQTAVAEAMASRPGRAGAGAHPASGRRRRAAADCAEARRRGTAGHRRDLPALPHAHRGGGARRRDPVQVLPADPGRGEPGRALGRASPTGPIALCRVGPLAVHARPEARRHRRLRRGLGRHRLAAARVCQRSGPRPGSGFTSGGRGDLDGAPARGSGRACPQGTHRDRRRRRPGRVRPGRDVTVVDPANCTTATRSRRTPVERLRGAVRTTWLRGRTGGRRDATRRAAGYGEP